MDPRPRLIEERRRLQSVRASAAGGLSSGDETGATGELSMIDQHPADVGSETFAREAEEGISESVEEELAEVDEALRRLDEGTYGRCQACGQPIDAERLQALPAARYCLEDARRAEEEAALGSTAVPHPQDLGG